jgi:hypothetical protein
VQKLGRPISLGALACGKDVTVKAMLIKSSDS